MDPARRCVGELHVTGINPIRGFFHAVGIVCVCITLSGCGADYIPMGQLRIDWDAHDPKLHGQKIRYTEPMVYVLLDERDAEVGPYTQEEIEIGRALVTPDFVDGFTTTRRDQGPPSTIEPIDQGTAFSIVASFVVRRNWIIEGFVDTAKRLVLEDPNNIRSTALLMELSLSDRSDLVTYVRSKGGVGI